jgi:hypothetical protein
MKERGLYHPFTLSVSLSLLLACLVIIQRATAWSPGGFPNQLGRTPQRGWRSWNAFGDVDINQATMLRMAQALARPRDAATGRSLVRDRGRKW